MAVMTHLVSIPSGRPFTVADLEAMPDDGNRYELIDGALIVSPAPSWEHQTMLFAVARRLDDVRPADLRVVMAPYAVQTAYDSEVQPDLLVARYADLRSKHCRWRRYWSWRRSRAAPR
jgi:Uma2 family endonuclease